MTEDLRTRIAAVVDAYFDTARREQGYIVDGVTGDEVADAVIRELLEREDGYRNGYDCPGPQPVRGGAKIGQPIHRYVTEWTADDC